MSATIDLTNAKPCPGCRRMLTTEPKCCHCAERDQLRAELEKLRCELDDAEERASEAEERCAAEWEKDCGQALRLLAQVTKFEWDQDGSPADEVREHIQITIESLEKQVVALRAELAAAKSLLARIHRDGGHHTEAVGVAQSVADAGEKVSEWLLAADERDALAADNARLRAALELGECYMKVFRHELARNNAMFEGSEDQAEVDGDLAKVQSALAATPSQSLAAHDAAVKVELLREVVEELRDMARDRDDSSYDIAAYTVEQKADRIEKEAANGKTGA